LPYGRPEVRKLGLSKFLNTLLKYLLFAFTLRSDLLVYENFARARRRLTGATDVAVTGPPKQIRQSGEGIKDLRYDRPDAVGTSMPYDIRRVG
jgi:hypothetical protein